MSDRNTGPKFGDKGYVMNNNDPKSIKEVVDDWQKRSHIERRAAREKRSADSSEYLSKGGKERRKRKERRHSDERRDGWLRVGRWRSVSVFDE
jgi:hypothetical protein